MKILTELTADELKALYNTNKFLQEQTFAEAEYISDENIAEITHHFRELKPIEYNIGYPSNHFCFNYYNADYDDYMTFFNICRKLAHDYCVFEDSTEKLLNRVNQKLEFYIDCIHNMNDISEYNTDRIYNWIESTIEKISDDILKYLVAEYNIRFDTDFLKEDALDSFINCQGDAYETDDKYIYEVERRKFA